MPKIGVIGEREKVLCYMAAGFCIYPASSPEEAKEKIKEAKNDNCRIIYITDDLAKNIQDGSVVPLPVKDSSFGFDRMSHAVARAVGSDIIYKEKR